VAGSGLVGRNPVAADGERVDYLVQIVDPHRSVSKTHLEFGVDGDTLWIADRGSANGTRFNLDLLEPIELSPGERMRVPRGTRIGIGDQWFDVH
jgi:predicted component of type VI protein secretion system